MINQLMIRNNTMYYFFSFFFMNLGRTIPHAVLTIFLLDVGLNLSQVAYLQIAFMITIMIFEIPSGYFSDKWSRKYTYIISIIFLFTGYLVVYLGYSNLYILVFAWVLYGLSTALNSGSMQSELINQFKSMNKDIKKVVVWNSYVSSASAALGAMLGSFLYVKIQSNMYVFTFICFFISVCIALLFKVEPRKKVTLKVANSNKSSLKKQLIVLIKTPATQEIIVLFTLLSLFMQPYFQYWQVLFDEKGISVALFGFIFILFQLCSILGSFIFDRLNYTKKHSLYIFLILIILTVFTLSFSSPLLFTISFLVILILFNIYQQALMVKLREKSNDSNISTFESLIGTSMNFSSILVLAAFSATINRFSLTYNYLIYFIAFYILSIFTLNIYRRRKSAIDKKEFSSVLSENE